MGSGSVGPFCRICLLFCSIVRSLMIVSTFSRVVLGGFVYDGFD